MSDSQLELSVIICTQNRGESLAMTLECLASANRDGISVEVVVVDNASGDNTKEVVGSFTGRIPIRYLHEPKQGVYGKSHCLNRAIEGGGLGEIVAVLDDDMSPHVEWFQGVMAICRRWPGRDIFTGDTYPIWPVKDLPGWVSQPEILGWIFSSQRITSADCVLEEGRWFGGNHWWFRSRVLGGQRRFRDLWLTEPDFQLDLGEDGYSGVSGPDAKAGHRVQMQLLSREAAVVRAQKTGSSYAAVRAEPHRIKVKQARLLRQHPRLGRLFCLISYLRWKVLFLVSALRLSDGSRFGHRLIAIERSSFYLRLLRIHTPAK